MSTATKYVLIADNAPEVQTVSSKKTAIRIGERLGGSFRVETDKGALVHEYTEDPTAGLPVEKVTKTRAKAKASDPVEDASSPAAEMVVSYRPHGPKHFWKALGVASVEAFGGSAVNKDMTVVLNGDDTDGLKKAAERLTTVWTDAMAALKEWKKTDPKYRAADKKFEWGRADAYRLEQAFLTRFVKDAAKADK